MNRKDIKRLHVEDEIVCAPEPFRGLPDLSDDYDVSAKINSITNKKVLQKVKQSIVCEEDYKYGPKTSYKGKYSYNRDD